MKTFPDLIREHELRRDLERERSSKAVDAVRRIHDRAKAERRAKLTSAETQEFDALVKAQEHANEAAQRADLELEELRAMFRTESENDALLATRAPDSTGEASRPAYDRVARVGSEERTYHRGNDRGRTGQQFLWDVVRAATHQDPGAIERLARHQREEQVERGQYLTRAAGSGAFAGLVVPQYLTDLYAPAVAAMRPFANVCAHHDLPPDGMTVNISRITTATSVALQASENSAVSETNIDDTLLTENVQTAAGQQTLSRQAIERGTAVEDITLADLYKRYATTLDSTLLNQATTGLAPVSTSQTYTNATVDTTAIPAAWKAVIQALNTVEGVLLGQAPVSHVIMNNRRWNWFTAAVSASWPVIAGTNVPPTSWGMQLTNEYGPSVRAVMANGLKVVVDANVSTTCLAQATTGGTQDHMYVVAADECHLWEDPDAPVFIRADQPAAASLGVLLVVYGYMAYSFRRYSGGSVVVNGTGLATPSFV